jgi:hypothetical protein
LALSQQSPSRSISFAAMMPFVRDQPAAAEIYRPWCVQYGGSDGDNGTTCAFTSFEQCMMTARGGGGFCVQNPWYLAYGSGQKSPESTGRNSRANRR